MMESNPDPLDPEIRRAARLDPNARARGIADSGVRTRGKAYTKNPSTHTEGNGQQKEKGHAVTGGCIHCGGACLRIYLEARSAASLDAPVDCGAAGADPDFDSSRYRLRRDRCCARGIGAWRNSAGTGKCGRRDASEHSFWQREALHKTSPPTKPERHPCARARFDRRRFCGRRFAYSGTAAGHDVSGRTRRADSFSFHSRTSGTERVVSCWVKSVNGGVVTTRPMAAGESADLEVIAQ